MGRLGCLAQGLQLRQLAFWGALAYMRSMATMISEVYDALVSAGAPEDKARSAAEALANYESRFSKVDADLLVLKWMTGFILAGVAGVVIKTFFP